MYQQGLSTNQSRFPTVKTKTISTGIFEKFRVNDYPIHLLKLDTAWKRLRKLHHEPHSIWNTRTQNHLNLLLVLWFLYSHLCYILIILKEWIQEVHILFWKICFIVVCLNPENLYLSMLNKLNSSSGCIQLKAYKVSTEF